MTRGGSLYHVILSMSSTSSLLSRCRTSSREFRLVLLEDSTGEIRGCWTTVLTCWMCLSLLRSSQSQVAREGTSGYGEFQTFWIKASHTCALSITAGSHVRIQERVKNSGDPVKDCKVHNQNDLLVTCAET
jgi:hypothetical protein